MISGFFTRVISGDLCCIGGRFTATLETHRTSRRPADSITLRISDGDHGVIEASVDMRNTARDILSVTAPYFAGFACHYLVFLILKGEGKNG
jgi:hypothetical protein